ncbi:MAG TPA: FAD binding domain-containing protein [Spirochaetia bacterium]|nr:FAD binding domain-containing protein [Spirochaetia bacterium]
MSYLFPDSVEQAVELLTRHEGRARIIAGGTDLMQALRDGALAPEVLIDVTRIPGLDEIQVEGDRLQVGAAVTFAALRDSPLVREHARCLALAAASVGAAPVQAAATWAGNIVQGMPAADGGVAAVALDAEARVVDADGARWVPVEALYKGTKLSVLDPTRQLLSHLRFVVPRSPCGSAWRRIGRRPSLTLPILNCAAALRLDASGETIEGVTLALGPAASLPFRARGAEAFLTRRPPTEESIQHAAALAQSECQVRSNPLRATREYRAAMIPVLVRQALVEARDEALGAVRLPAYRVEG